MRHIFNKRSGLSKRLIAGIMVLLLVVGFGVLELTGVTHVFHKEKPKAVASGSSFAAKGEPKNTQSSAPGGASDNTASGSSNSKITGSSATLITPYGDFVSNHHPNLSGSPAPNTLSSVCSTTPGASCEITFTKNGVVKSLSAETTDVNGAAYWNNWSLQSIGLTAGSWQIQAIANLNGQTKSATDAMALVVSQ